MRQEEEGGTVAATDGCKRIFKVAGDRITLYLRATPQHSDMSNKMTFHFKALFKHLFIDLFYMIMIIGYVLLFFIYSFFC